MLQSQFPNRPLRVFLAEDSRPDVCLVKMALQEHTIPFTLRVATDGEEAIDAVKRFGSGEERPDIALLDLNLPRQEGAKVIQHLRSQPGCERTPIVVMTASQNEKDRALASRFCAAFFSKPAELTEFLQLGALVKSLTSSH